MRACSTATGQARFRDAFLEGFDYLLAAQYPNGGWPQSFPLRADYSRHITFNDNAMVNVLGVMDDASQGRAGMAFVDKARRARAAAAVAKGIDVILAAQIRVRGALTAWCAQVDEVTLEPRKARAYEHPVHQRQRERGDRPLPDVAAVAVACDRGRHRGRRRVVQGRADRRAEGGRTSPTPRCRVAWTAWS